MSLPRLLAINLGVLAWFAALFAFPMGGQWFARAVWGSDGALLGGAAGFMLFVVGTGDARALPLYERAARVWSRRAGVPLRYEVVRDDSYTEAMGEGRTLVLVTHRISAAARCDKAVVLDAGRVVGYGTHDELLISNETYQEIVESQLSVEEAAA